MVSLPPSLRRKRSSLYVTSLSCAFLFLYFVLSNSLKLCSTVQSQQSISLRAPVSLSAPLVSPIPSFLQPHASTGADVLHHLTSSAPSQPLNLSNPYTHPSLSSTERCYVAEYILPYPFPRVSVCIRPYNDLVSNHIRIHRTWSDCNVLIELFYRYRSRYGDTFVDVGSNIGACTFTLLAAGATVVAFEPTPSNLFYLTQTVAINRKAHPDWVKRLIVFPVGLGEGTFTSRVYPEPGNAGNAVIGRPVLDNETDVTSGAGRKRMEELSFEVSIHRLDDFFMNGDTPIISAPAMKMDVQGFETKVLRGAKKWLANGSVASMRYEVARNWLVAQGSSWKELHSVVKDSGFVVGPCGNRILTKFQGRRNFPKESQYMQEKKVLKSLESSMTMRGSTDCNAIIASEA